MANRVITIGSGKQERKDLEVYLDIDMQSKPYNTVSGDVDFKIQKLINARAVQNSLKNIFTWIPGERVLLPEFGSRLRDYIYQQITDVNQEAIMAEIRHSVSEWEPRAVIDKVVKVTDTGDMENNTVAVEVYYHVKGLDDEQYMYSFPWYGNNRD